MLELIQQFSSVKAYETLWLSSVAPMGMKQRFPCPSGVMQTIYVPMCCLALRLILRVAIHPLQASYLSGSPSFPLSS